MGLARLLKFHCRILIVTKMGILTEMLPFVLHLNAFIRFQKYPHLY